MRVAPRPLIAVTITVAYAVLITIYGLAADVDYETLADSTSNVVTGILIPIAVLAALLAAVATWLGWWRPALFERPSGPRWLLLVPVLMVVSIAVTLATADWGGHGAGFLVVLLIGTLLVGFNEELLTRGLGVVAFRGRMGEVGVWFWTSALFGLIHGANLFTGQDLGPTLQQIVFAFVFGSVFYVIRRVTGTLVVCMVLHGLWDFSTFLATGDDTSGTTSDFSPGVAIAYLPVLMVIIGGWALLRRRPAPAGDPTPTSA
jgi:membrane protease YdiL (CAAX protease family)